MNNRIPLQYVGPAGDASGYANACRSYLSALIDTDEVDLSVHTVSFEQQKTTHGRVMNKIEPFLNRKVQNKIQLVHLTPENYPTLKQAGKYCIGYTTWETETLPKSWASLCNLMDEIWVPSEWNIDVFRKSGVVKPIHKVPHIVELPDIEDAIPISIEASDDTYVFYSIFQWLERKNPVGLLKAYLTEFQPNEKVCLVLKTYRLDTSGKEQQAIKNDIATIKRALNLPDYPEIFLYGNLMSSEALKGLHLRGDCFVLPHRGEGFGIPHAEAMSYGKPVIATNYSGNLEFMNKENSFLVNACRTPVSGMLFSKYNASMTWGDPDIMHLRELMRFCFTERKKAQEAGRRARLDIQNNLNSNKIGSLIVERLRVIHEQI
jgi:glycosyltransferase involved in cell wall biosynthesis